MFRLFALFLFFAALAAAQPAYRDLSPILRPFSGLSTNRDGSLLLFSSPLRLTGAVDQPAWEKIFSWTAKDGVRLYAQNSNPGFRETANLPGNVDGTGFYHMLFPSISSDGKTVALTGQNDCSFGTPCATSVERWESAVQLADGSQRKLPRSVSLSANGRYALAQSSRPFGLWIVPDVTWINLLSGELVQTSTRSLIARGSRPIADDGSTVRQVGDQLELWRPGFNPFRQTESIPLQGLQNRFFGGTVLSADAKVVVTSFFDRGMVAYEVATGQIQTITSEREASALDISEDGSVILLQHAERYRTFRRNSMSFRDLPISGRADEIILSGDGLATFVIQDSRILRIDVDSGQVQEIVPRTHYASVALTDPTSGSLARGSLLRISNVANNVLTGGPAKEARFGKETWPVLSSNEAGAFVQVPWDAPLDIGPNFLYLTLNSPANASPFESAWILARPRRIVPAAPFWFAQPDSSLGFLLAVHEDFSSLLSYAAPARPGETVHVYGSGFGDVTPAVPTGKPASMSILSRLTATPQCSVRPFEGPAIPLEVRFAGLAPGLIGVVQLDLKLPDSLPSSGNAVLNCALPGASPIGASALLPLSR